MKQSERFGKCPTCETKVFPDKIFGMWDGKREGKKVGGPVLKATCPQCGTTLIAFSDILEEHVEWKVEQKTLPKIPD
jgi:hypothetical protein